MRTLGLLCLGFLLALTAPLGAADFKLQMDRLTEGLKPLPKVDARVVDETIQLIQKGNHAAALVRLSELNRNNPQNSSLRILTSYAMLQLGNLLGAFEEADKAHKASDGNSYKCWFLAKVALLNGKRDVCERELKHVKGAGDMTAEARALEAEMNRPTP